MSSPPHPHLALEPTGRPSARMSVHCVAVFRRVGDRRDDVPMLDEFAVRHSENIDTDVAVRANETGPVGVDGHDVSVGDDATNIAFCVGEVLEEKIDVSAQALDTVLCGRRVLDVSVADISSDGSIDVAVEVRLSVEGKDGLFVLFRDGFGGHVDFPIWCDVDGDGDGRSRVVLKTIWRVDRPDLVNLL